MYELGYDLLVDEEGIQTEVEMLAKRQRHLKRD